MKEKMRVKIDLDLEIIANAVVRDVIKNVSEETEPEETIVAKLAEEAVKAEKGRGKRYEQKMEAYNRNMKKGNHERIIQAARRAVYEAIKRGQLVRPETCSACGNGSHEPIHGHYECYHPENHLNVDWLCKSCHYKLHNNKKKNGGEQCIREQELRYH